MSPLLSEHSLPSTGFRQAVFQLPVSDVESSAVLKKLVLLGGDHGDSEGFHRASAFFRDYQPDLILVELSPFGLHIRKKRGRHFLKVFHDNLHRVSRRLDLIQREVWRHPVIVRIRRQICLPFEYRAARHFAKSQPARLMLCDASELSRLWTAQWPGLISQTNLELLLSQGDRVGSKAGMSVSLRKALVEERPEMAFWAPLVESREDAWWEWRERYMAREIWIALHGLNPNRPVYIGGWQHILKGRSRRTLRDLLGIPQERCCLLDTIPVTRLGVTASASVQQTH